MAERLQLRLDSWTWDGYELEVRYEDPLPKRDVYKTRQRLRDILGGLTVPATALAGVENTPPQRNKYGIIRLVPRPYASPFHQVAGVAISDAVNPLLFAYSAETSLLVDYYLTEIKRSIQGHGLADIAADEATISIPNPLKHLTAHDAIIGVEGQNLSIVWGKEASREKLQSKRQRSIPLANIESIRYASDDIDPDSIGYIQITPTGIRPEDQQHPTRDPNSVLLFSDEQYAEGMLFAAHLATLTPAGTRGAKATGATDTNVIEDPIEELRGLLRLRDSQQINEQDFRNRKWEIFKSI